MLESQSVREFDDETRAWAMANGVSRGVLACYASNRAVDALIAKGFIVERDGLFYRNGKRPGDPTAEVKR